MERPLGAAGTRHRPVAGCGVTRIVSGAWGGRRLVTPPDRRVRPTAERVREAWLNILMPMLSGARVLDLCAGSGALGLEALSRGAAEATFVELNAAPLDALRRNIASLGAEARSQVHRADALRFVTGRPAGDWDVALADPPFAGDLAERLVARWRETPFAALLAIEHAAATGLAGGETRRWGDIAVTFFRAP